MLNRNGYADDATARFDMQGFELRKFYEVHCSELHLGGWRGKLKRFIRGVFFGFVDYDVDRDRHGFMLGLINEVQRILIGSKDIVYYEDYEKVVQMVHKSNELLRSMSEIAKREMLQPGERVTNWEPFYSQLSELLLEQHKFMHPEQYKNTKDTDYDSKALQNAFERGLSKSVERFGEITKRHENNA